MPRLIAMPSERKLPKYVKAIPRGRIVHLYFRHGRTYLRLPRNPDSPEFHRAYAEALEGIQKPSAKRLAEGSVAAMSRDFKAAPEYTGLVLKTQRDYARMLDHLTGALGHFPANSIRRPHIIKLRNKIAAASGNRTADLFVAVVARCFKIGRDLNYVEISPAAEIDRINDPKNFKPWPAEARAKFEASNPPAHLMTGYMIGLWTAQGLGDVLRLARPAYDGFGFQVRRAKIRRSKTRGEGYIPAHSRLKAYLAKLPRDAMLFVARADGSRISERIFSEEFRAWLDGLGLHDLHFHGLRKTTATALADAGASAHEIASITLHQTMAMVEHYTRSADQRRLATAAIHKLEVVERGTKRKRKSGNTANQSGNS